MREKIKEIVERVKQHMSGTVAQSMENLGVSYKLNYGVNISELREIAKDYLGDHELALALFQEDIRECKILASMIDDPEKVTGEQIDNWAQSFSNVELVEQVCSNLFWKSDYALSRSIEWSLSNDELMQRAGLIIAAHSAFNADIKDSVFEPYLEIINNFDDNEIATNKNSIAFALRSFAKRNDNFKENVLSLANTLAESEDVHRAWIGGQLLFELDQ